MQEALLLNARDTVATLLASVSAGETVQLRAANPEDFALRARAARTIVVSESIPFGHKIAICPHAEGDPILKYGASIGEAAEPLAEGEYVHVHNLRPQAKPQPETAAHTVTDAELHEVVLHLMQQAGLSRDNAESLADYMCEAHLRGIETHGIRRIPPYLDRIACGGVALNSVPDVKGEQAVLQIDGRNGVGHLVAVHACDAVIERAAKLGMAAAFVKNSNHFGFAGYYAVRMAQAGHFGIVCSNGQPCLAPPGGQSPLFSNNPLAMAAPADVPGRYMELDLSTSVSSRAKIATAAANGQKIASGLAQDAQGQPTTSPEEGLRGTMLPLAGERGFALLVALEALTGILAGGAFADQVSSKETNPDQPEGVSHLFLAIRLDVCGGEEMFCKRFGELAHKLHTLPMRQGADAPRYPGERRWALRQERLQHGIPLCAADAAVLDHLRKKTRGES